MKKKEADKVMNMTSQIAAIVQMEPALNEIYQNMKRDTCPWQSKKDID